MDLKNIAFSRLAEPLSEGKNIKDFLELHISPYVNKVKYAEILNNIKSVDNAEDIFLDWLGVIKGVQRPKTTINNDDMTPFFNVLTPDNFGFSNTDLSKPLYFGQSEFFVMGDMAYRGILSAYCKLTGFRGTVTEYSLFFKDIFGVNVQIRSSDYNLDFIIEDSRLLNIDVELGKKLVPSLPQTKNNFFQSPYLLFSLEFNNIGGTNLDFDSNVNSSLYFPF